MAFLTLDASNSEAAGTALIMPPGSKLAVALGVDNQEGGEALRGTSTGTFALHGESDGDAGVFGDSRADATDRHTQTAGVIGSSAHQPKTGRDAEGMNAGVWGDSIIDFGTVGTSVQAPGVLGTSETNHGVLGITGSSRGGAGVTGIGNETAPGVDGNGGPAGVIGTSFTGGPGVLGLGSGGAVGVTGNGGTAGVFGVTDSPAGAGVQGSSGGQGAGVWGWGSANWPGVEGFSAEGNGVRGVSVSAKPGSNVGVVGFSTEGIGVVGMTASPSALGGFFSGGLVVAGGPKSAAVPHSDGAHRLLYTVESPESWFEDFGRAKLEKGVAEVRLDTEFTAVVETEDYHVFLSPEGESLGLYVSNKTPTGFDVRESQGGTSDITFSYRVVVKRSDVHLERLQRFELPEFDHEAMVKTAVQPEVPNVQRLEEAPRLIARHPRG